MDQIIRIGLDTSKQNFQLHGVNAAEEPVLRRKLRRTQMMAFFAAQPRTVIGIEAGGAAHHWSRNLLASLYRYVEPRRRHLVLNEAISCGFCAGIR